MDAKTLGEVMGWTLSEDRYSQLLPAYLKLMQWANITNVNRAAMLAAQLGHESVGLKYQSEIASGDAYEGRQDLGNIHAGDGVRFKGHGWIQITGRQNHTEVSKWAHGKGIVPSPTFFVDDPAALGNDQYCWVGPAWYWTIARPDINALSDARDLHTVTRRINGGLNGLADRQARYNRALAMGGRLLPSGDGPVTVEKRLDYSRAEIAQDRYYWCGPASCQTIINSRTGEMVPEGVLAYELGTHIGGTDYIGQLRDVLNNRIGGGYKVVEMPNDPPSGEQREKLWNDIRGSITGGFGVAINIVAPPSNYPRASYTSTISPAYGGGTVYHYFAAMGYAVDSGGGRHVWIADSGFSPFGYWCTLDQLASLIPPKGYAFPASAWTEPADDIGGFTVDQADRVIKHVTDFIKGYIGPIGSDTKDIRAQLTGGRDSIPGDVEASYPGWPQLGTDKNGRPLTLVDGVAASRRDIAELAKRIEKLEGRK